MSEVAGDFCGYCKNPWPCGCDDPIHCCGICAGSLAHECRCTERDMEIDTGETMKLWEVLPEFMKALEEQLKSDDKRWGDTWLKRTREGQELRTRETFRDYFDRFENGGTPINWLAVAGNALICWYREQHPEMWPK